MAKTHKSNRKPACAVSGKQKARPVASKKNVAKHKSKKGSSLFGPLSSQQPRSMKWNLTDSMGGSSKKASSKNSGRKKTNIKKRSTATTDRQEKPQKSKPWTLSMPIVSSTDPVVPWLMREDKQCASDKRDKCPLNRFRKIHHGLSLPAASLTNLNNEMHIFADYVRLNEAEIASRQSVVELIQTCCRHLFGISTESCKVFGSFACLPVCNFISDVDMAIHDVVPGENPRGSLSTTQAAATANDVDIDIDGHDDDDPTPKRPSKLIHAEGLHPHPNLRRQERVVAWKKALDEAEQSRNDREVKLLGSTAKCEREVVRPEDHDHVSPSTEPVTGAGDSLLSSSPPRTEFAPIQHDPTIAVTDDDGYPLFVIDKEGFSDPEESPVNAKSSDTDAPTVTDTSTSREPSTMSDDDAQNEEGRCFIGMASRGQAVAASSWTDAKHNESACSRVDSDDECQIQRKGNESDGDSADILVPSRRSGVTSPCKGTQSAVCIAESGRQRGPSSDDEDSENEEEPLLNDKTRSRSHSVISLCSATTCSDTEEKEWDDSGIEVSVVSNGSSAPKFAPTAAPALDDETRTKVIRALNCLSRRLRGNSLASNIHVRKKAKVPIINMETRFGYECDIAIGGHNGTDTSSFASSQCRKFRSFADVVLLLKILLNQHGLDKPFTGGIGSFKLYVLVASHIEKHLELGGVDDAAEILISFLFRYGNVPEAGKRSSDSTLRSPLNENTIVTAQGLGAVRVTADMGSIFQLENCIKLFQACYFILRRKLLKPSNDPSHSLLGYIIDSQLLRQQRLDCQRRIPHAMVQHREPTFSPGLPLNARANARPRSVQSSEQKCSGGLAIDVPPGARTKRKGTRVEHGVPAPMVREYAGFDTEDEAEQLKSRYGISASETCYPKSPSNKKSASKKRHRTETR